MRSRELSVLIVVLASAPAAFGQATPNGVYRLQGETPQGERYRGRVVARVEGGELVVSRQLEGDVIEGGRGNASPDPLGRWTLSTAQMRKVREAVGVVDRVSSWFGGDAPPARSAGHTAVNEQQLEISQRAGGGYKARLRVDGEEIARERWLPARKDVIYLAMGDHGAYEVKNLRDVAVDVIGITDSGDDVGNDRLEWRGEVYDLTRESRVHDLLREAGAPEACWDAATAAILRRTAYAQTARDTRDELGQLARVLAEAEVGERVVERLVISGHSSGSSVWGDHNGSLPFETILSLFEAFPKAAAQVEDIYFSACYTGAERILSQFRRTLPNLKTFWAYKGSAPGTWTGANVHASRWEAASRGSKPSAVHRMLAVNTRKGENVATWNVSAGFMAAGAFRSAEEVERDLRGMSGLYSEYLCGQKIVEDAQTGPLRVIYGLIHQLVGMEIRPELRAELEERRDQCIRLIFYRSSIRHRFVEANSVLVEEGFAALDLEVPDFGELSRAEALGVIRAFEEAFGVSSGPEAAARLLPHLIEGLRDLSPTHVPDPWI